MEEEIWKKVIGYEELYEISNFGRVKSLPKLCGHSNRKELILSPNKGKHYVVVLNKKGQRKNHFVHVLVALHFIPNPNNYPFVRHLDDIIHNNYITNLAWGTHKMNMEDKVRNNKSSVGEKNGQSKLTNTQILEIRSKYIPRKYSSRKLAKEFNVSQRLILNIIQRNSWKHI